MITGRIRKAGNSYVVSIPPKEMEERGLSEGQLVGLELVAMELRPVTPPRLAPEKEDDTSEDIPHAEVMREWNERMAHDITTGLVHRAEIEQARQELERDAPWIRSL